MSNKYVKGQQLIHPTKVVADSFKDVVKNNMNRFTIQHLNVFSQL